LQALQRIKVLDISGLAPGPFCTMLLADFGADVIIVEPPTGIGRRYQPADPEANAYSPLFRNKRSMALNLKDPIGREIFLRLADEADVIVEGFRPGVVKRLGIEYETVQKRNRRIVYCSLSGYGQDGPYAQLPGHDINYISLGGALGMINSVAGDPAIPMNLLADYSGGGLYAAFAIMIALFAREATDRGQYIDMAMSDGVASLISPLVARYLRNGWTPAPGREILNGGVPYYHVYTTADQKQLSVGCIEPWFWERLCLALGCEEFIDEQFNERRHGEILRFMEDQFLSKTRDEWFEELRQADVCAAPVYTLDEIFDDQHVKSRHILTELTDPRYGKVMQVGVAPRLSETPGSLRKTSPVRGEDTLTVLESLGFTSEQVEALEGQGIVMCLAEAE
jgi:alpha-methylacyl-CoA racemase